MLAVPQKPHPYHPVKTIAELLQVPVHRVYREIASGNLPAIRLGKTIRIADEDLNRWLAAHRTTGGEA